MITVLQWARGTASAMAIVAAACTLEPATAQTQDGTDVIIVTGSLIDGVGGTSALPVEVLDENSLRRLGQPTPVELFKGLPSAAGLIGDANQFDTRSQFTEGQASVNLRGLGPQRTLVLLDGLRLSASQADIVGVDINTIPFAALDRIEVLKDGGASTYGSDAIAGVVNFITRDDQTGIRFAGSTRFVADAGNDADISVSYGFERGRFHGLLAAGYQFRAELLARDRSYALTPFEENPGGGFTGGGNPGSFVPYATDNQGNPFALAGLTPDADCEALGGVVPDRCRTRFVPFDALREKQHRRQAFVRLGADLTDSIDASFTGLYARTEVPHYRTSASFIPIQGASNNPIPGTNGFFVPGSNPGLQQYAEEFSGMDDALPMGTEFVVLPALVWRPFLAGGNPLFAENTPENRAGDTLGGGQGYREVVTTRLTASLRGERPDGQFSWETAAVWQRYERNFDNFDTLVDRLQLALQGLGGPDCNAANGVPGQGECYWFNPFGNASARNPALGLVNPGGGAVPNDNLDLIRWFLVEADFVNQTELFAAEVTANWQPRIMLPGGPITVAGGLQFRRNEIEVKYGDVLDRTVTPCRDTVTTGNTNCPGEAGALALFPALVPFSAVSDIWAAHGEVLLPLSSDLSVQVAARFEQYGDEGGSSLDPRLSARWDVAPWIAFRGSAATTFRAPSPQTIDASAVTTSFANIRGSFRPTDIAGNPELEPEKSLNLSAGVQLDFGFLSGSIDYWRYEIEDQIVVEPLAGLVDTLFPVGRDDLCGSPEVSNIEERFTFDGGICSVDGVARVRREYVNGGGIDLDGVDVSIRFEHPNPVFGGVVTADATATYNRTYQTSDQLIGDTVVERGFDAAGRLNFQTTAYPIPRVKSRGIVAWEKGPWAVAAIFRYVSGYDDTRAGVRPEFETVDATLLSDLSATYQVKDGIQLTAAVFNVADRDPPGAQLEYSYDTFTGDPLGRTVRVGIDAAF